MTATCDHKSVGVIVVKDNKILLIKKKKFPFALAAPAGHVDTHGEHLDEPEQFMVAASEELNEETGLVSNSLDLLYEGRKENPCGRSDGTWHYWRVYLADATDTPNFSVDETDGHLWADATKLRNLLNGEKEAIDKNGESVSVSLEAMWQELFTDINVFNLLANKK